MVPPGTFWEIVSVWGPSVLRPTPSVPRLRTPLLNGSPVIGFVAVLFKSRLPEAVSETFAVSVLKVVSRLPKVLGRDDQVAETIRHAQRVWNRRGDVCPLNPKPLVRRVSSPEPP